MTQNQALTILKTGKSVFLTGEPGSGKTHTVNRYIAWLREHSIQPAITASTGIAATHIGGMTVHSWSGIGVSTALSPDDLAAIAGRQKVRKRVAAAGVLIIDEVSMLSAATFSMVDLVCRKIRESLIPFGGLQVIVVGDFFQLPPVAPNGEKAPFAYESDAWQRLNPVVCYLGEQHRQDDPVFLSLLGAIRRNACGAAEHATLKQRLCETPNAPENIPRLFPHNADVDRINAGKLAKLPGPAVPFVMEAHGPQDLVEFLKKSCLSPELLELKTRAAVMFTKNSTERQFVNGTLGFVVGFDRATGYPIVRTRERQRLIATPMEWAIEEGGKTRARVAQIPLRLAWAITIHKSQGMSMDAAVMDLAAAFEYGQGYVALSRVRNLAGLYLLGINGRALETHPDVARRDVQFRVQSEKTEEHLRGLSAEDITFRQTQFIRRCGGQVSVARDDSHSPTHPSTYETTRELALKKLSVTQITQHRNLTPGTIISHLEKLVAAKRLDPRHELLHLRPEAGRFEKIKTAFEAVTIKEGRMALSPAYEILGGDVTFDELRLARLFL
ncbi:MAG: AAA family ATPase [Patescibacteria group bacterium]